jgi:phenylacetate-CoA ligase
VLATFDAASIDGELVLVDDGSRDGTRLSIERAARVHADRVVGTFHDGNRGIAAAWKTGVDASRGRLVALLDADLQYQPEDLPRLRDTLIEENVDVVQGFRSAVGRERDARYGLSRGFNALLNATFGMHLSDNKSGFVLCGRDVMLDVLSHEGTYRYFQSFIMVAVHAKGYSYREIETLFLPRRAGKSFLDGRAYRVAAESLVDLGKAAVEYRLESPGRISTRSLDTKRRHERADADLVAAPATTADHPRTVPAARTLAWKTYLRAFERTHWTMTRDVESRYESLERTQWLSRQDVLSIQDEKLRRLVHHAYRNVPYYRSVFQAARLSPADIRGVGDLQKLPFLTKAHVRDHLHHGLLSDDHRKSEMLRIRTSGSTGEPLACYVDRTQLEQRWAATLRSQGWAGYRFGDRSVRLWHQTLGLDASQQLKERLDAALSRRKFIPVFELREDGLAEVLADIARYEPSLLDGYTEALDFMARFIVRRGASAPRPGAVMTSAQTLSGASRALIETAFRCAVFDKYGAREFSGIAYECEAHAGHHVVAESYVVEILKGGVPARPGEIGEVVVTDLTNRCMPFIRYRLGDLAIAMADSESCACGRGLPRIGDIEGRIQSIIQGTDGRFLPGTFFSHYLKDFDHAIARYQVLQERRGAIIFRFVAGGRFSAESLAEILATFRRHLGEDMTIDVDRVPKIELLPTGKHLATLSRLDIDFQRHPGARLSGN